MNRRSFISKGSAIVGMAAAWPSVLTATSGMFSSPTERRIAQVLNARRTMVQNVPVLRSFGGGDLDLVSPFVMLDEFGLPCARDRASATELLSCTRTRAAIDHISMSMVQCMGFVNASFSEVHDLCGRTSR